MPAQTKVAALYQWSAPQRSPLWPTSGHQATLATQLSLAGKARQVTDFGKLLQSADNDLAELREAGTGSDHGLPGNPQSCSRSAHAPVHGYRVPPGVHTPVSVQFTSVPVSVAVHRRPLKSFTKLSVGELNPTKYETYREPLIQLLGEGSIVRCGNIEIVRRIRPPYERFGGPERRCSHWRIWRSSPLRAECLGGHISPEPKVCLSCPKRSSMFLAFEPPASVGAGGLGETCKRLVLPDILPAGEGIHDRLEEYVNTQKPNGII